MESRKNSGSQSMTTVVVVVALMFLLLDSVVASSRFLPNLPEPEVNSSTPGLGMLKSHQTLSVGVRSLLIIPAPSVAPSPGTPFGPGLPPPVGVRSLLPILAPAVSPSPGTPVGPDVPPPRMKARSLLPAVGPSSPSHVGPDVPPPVPPIK